MNILTIPVTIERVDAHHLFLRTHDSTDDCPQCARGEGCGTRPWFRGLRQSRNLLRIPRNPHPWQTGERAVLQLPARILNRIALLTYGVPLIIFLLTLAASQSLAPILQILPALLLAAFSVIPARRYGERLIGTHLSLIPCTAPRLFHRDGL